MRTLAQITSVLLVGSLLIAQITGFGTGSHFDVTRNVLTEHGFDEHAIRMIQVGNWLTDYYATSPTRSDEHRAELEKLHFDNLYTEDQVLDYWYVFLRNLRNSTESAAKESDVFGMLIVIGIAMHGVQDFYSHSNWAEMHPRSPTGDYRSETIIKAIGSNPRPSLKGLQTGTYPDDRTTAPDGGAVPPGAAPHGSYLIGLNKDSPERPHWDEAYVFAYAASHEIIDAMQQWANDIDPAFWELVKNYKPAPGDEEVRLVRDYGAARKISMWFEGKGQNGIWKGRGSGSSRFFAAFASKWVPAHRSYVMKEMHDGPIPADLSKDLYLKARGSAMPELTPFLLERNALLVKIGYIGEQKDGGLHPGKMMSMGGTDFYSKIVIDGQEFWGKTIQNKRETADPWFEIYIYDPAMSSLPIDLTIWDEDNLDETEDKPVDVNPKAGIFGLNMVFDTRETVLNGDIKGTFDSIDRQFDSQGEKPDERRARIRGTIVSRAIR